MPITPVHPTDQNALIQLAVATGLFTEAEATDLLGGVLAAHWAGELPPGHQVAACRADLASAPLGWCYFAPDDHADGVWNLWWVGVAPAHHGTGVGARLLDHVEAAVKAAGGRLLIIETSDGDGLARARRFYQGRGYRPCGCIPDFYAEGEAKLVFARRP